MQIQEISATKRLAVSMLFLLVAFAAHGWELIQPLKSSPYLLFEYWPVFSEAPSVLGSDVPVIDLVVDAEGAAYEVISTLPDNSEAQAILRDAATRLTFAAGSVEGGANPGFCRYPVLTYFVLSEADRKRVTAAPVANFRMPTSIIRSVAPAIIGSSANSIELIVELKADGTIQSIKGRTKHGRQLAEKVFSKLSEDMIFKPAEKDGKPVPVKLHLHINKTGGLLNKAFKTALDVPAGNRPAPARPEGDYKKDEPHSVRLGLFDSGRISNIQFLDQVTEAEVLAATRAFRLWRFDNTDDQQLSFTRVVVTYTYHGDSPVADIQSVEMPDDIQDPPMPFSRAAPVYPDHLRRKGISGQVKVLFIIDERGRVESVEVEGSDHPDFSAAAAAAIYKWKFDPAKDMGMRVKSRVRMTIPFNYNR